MNTINITSQGQVTIPAKVRRLWGITTPQGLNWSFDPQSQRLIIEKPLSTSEFLSLAHKLTEAATTDITPLRADEVHEFYAHDRTKDIVARMKDVL